MDADSTLMDWLPSGILDKSVPVWQMELAAAANRLSPSLEDSLPAPQPGAQSKFLQSTADIVLYGGAAGSGKTLGLLLDFAKKDFLKNPDYGGVIFRRTFPQIHNEGGLWDESGKLYPQIGGVPKESSSEWRFPSGATIRFAHLQHEKNVYDWQGSQIVRIGFDELTHYSEQQFFYLLSRNRSTNGIKPQIRCTCNPDAESWVASFIDWWIGSDGLPIPERSGKVRWFIRQAGEFIWADKPSELRDRYPDSDPKSFTFIAASIYDNPILLEKDPGYLANLKALHPVEQARLLGGNWKVRYESGKVFNRTWFEIVDEVPEGGSECRFWDLAATEKDLKQDACYTSGVKMRKVGEITYVLDVIAEQVGPAQGDELIQTTALQDGRWCKVRWELEGGSAGKRDEAHLKDLLYGYDAEAVRPLGDKVKRAVPFASDAKRGNVKLLRAAWNNQYLSWLSQFPEGKVKDPVDASSGCYSELNSADTWLDDIL